MKHLPYVRVCLSRFYTNLNISFIYKDIFTKFAGNVYGYENMSGKFWPHFEKQNGRHSQLFENHKDALNLEILPSVSSNLYRRYMASVDLKSVFDKLFSFESSVTKDFKEDKFLCVSLDRAHTSRDFFFRHQAFMSCGAAR